MSSPSVISFVGTQVHVADGSDSGQNQQSFERVGDNHVQHLALHLSCRFRPPSRNCYQGGKEVHGDAQICECNLTSPVGIQTLAILRSLLEQVNMLRTPIHYSDTYGRKSECAFERRQVRRKHIRGNGGHPVSTNYAHLHYSCTVKLTLVAGIASVSM